MPAPTFLYFDTFNRANTATGTGLGSTDTGTPLAWSTISGDFNISSNKAVSTTAIGSNPIAVVDVSTPHAVASVNVGSGGDCLYFRVVDATNWWRVRTTQTVVLTGNYTISAWGPWYNSSGTTTFCTPGGFGYQYGYPSAERECIETSTAGVYSWRDRYRTITADSITTNTVVLEKSVAGVVTNKGTYGGSSPQVQVSCFGDDIEWFRYSSGFVSLGTVTDATHNTVTTFGIGRGASDSANHGLDNFSVQTVNYNRPPLAPTLLAPATAGTVSITQQSTYDWVFNDPDASSTQSEFALVRRKVAP